MSRRDIFDKKLELDWHSINDSMPLDEHFKEYPQERSWGLLTTVLVLILDFNDPYNEPSIVQIEYLVDPDGVGSWHWPGGEPYVECHARNIKFWADVPDYSFKSVMEEFKK